MASAQTCEAGKVHWGARWSSDSNSNRARWVCMKSGWSCICCLYLGPLVMPTPLLRQKLLRRHEPVHGHSLVLDNWKIQVAFCDLQQATNSTNHSSLRTGDDPSRNWKHQNLPEPVVHDCSWLHLHACQDTEMSLLCPADHNNCCQGA